MSSDKVSTVRICVGLALVLLAFVPSASAQTYHVLLVGDSWAYLMNYDSIIDTVFDNHGRSDLNAKGDTTAINGSTASDWTQPAYLQLITDELDANPSIEVVQLVIGGNDFLAGQSGGGWYQGMTQTAEDQLFAQIVADIETVVDHILAYDSEIEVLVSSYDYPNFVESLILPCPSSCPDYWDDLGQPTAEQINNAGTRLETARRAMLASKARTTSVDHYGYMQYAIGYASQGISPGDLFPPGDNTLPSPPEAMALNCDCTHLNATGYTVVVEHLWDMFYGAHFEPIFEDGFESGNTTAWSSSVGG
jgi:lysophospholipase L1-like esterase